MMKNNPLFEIIQYPVKTVEVIIEGVGPFYGGVSYTNMIIKSDDIHLGENFVLHNTEKYKEIRGLCFMHHYDNDYKICAIEWIESYD